MRRIVVSMFVSLDGLMEDPGGAGQFEHGGWTRSYWGDDIGQAWPSMRDEQGFADRMNGLPTFVSRRLEGGRLGQLAAHGGRELVVAPVAGGEAVCLGCRRLRL